MPNPYLPNHEYIPDGEPRLFGDRVYIYGSHDLSGSDSFCDYKLKVWSASIENLSDWVCHGDIFHTRDDEDHKADIDWSTDQLFAPDVVEKDGKYYLFAYIVGTKGCIAVSDKPEGPFKLLSQYLYNKPIDKDESFVNHGSFIDPGVLIDNNKAYVYCGYLYSYMVELDFNDLYKVIDNTYIENIIPVEEPFNFFEACSPRKVGDTYYMIYSPKRGSTLVYATSKSPTGPFEYRGVIIDNGVDYPGGNNHGSICKIKNQWYIFYHRMTNGTIMSRRGCVEKIDILPDGTIPQICMTSLGFDNSLSPYKITPADIACVLKEGCIITEKNKFTRVITNIKNGAVIGYKYFDFGEDYSSKTMNFFAYVNGLGAKAKIHIKIDNENGEEIGCCDVNEDNAQVNCRVKNITGTHAIYFVIEAPFSGDFVKMFDDRLLFELVSFLFEK